MRRAAALALVLGACGARTELGGAANDDLAPDFAWYKLDERGGTTAHDSTPHHYDVDVGGVAWGDGARFDGTTCGTTSVAPAFRARPLSITAWLTPAARADETSNAWALTPFPPDALSGDAPTLGGYGLGLDAWTDSVGGAAVAVETGADATVAYHSLSGPFSPGARRFAALVVDASGPAHVYVDGALLADVTANVPPAVAPAPLHLGCHNLDEGYGTKRFFRGRIRDARVYTRALAPSEVAELFARGPV